MIKKAVHEDELIYGMQRELQGHNKKQAMADLDKAGNYLQAAMEVLEQAGFTKQSDAILQILAKIANEGKKPDDVIEFTSLVKEPHKEHHKKPQEEKEEKIEFKSLMKDDEHDARHKPKNPTKVHDPHVKGLTPEKMVENLKHHGIVFNMADDGQANDLLNVDISHDDNDVIEVSEEKPDVHDFEEEIESK